MLSSVGILGPIYATVSAYSMTIHFFKKQHTHPISSMISGSLSVLRILLCSCWEKTILNF